MYKNGGPSGCISERERGNIFTWRNKSSRRKMRRERNTEWREIDTKGATFDYLDIFSAINIIDDKSSKEIKENFE